MRETRVQSAVEALNFSVRQNPLLQILEFYTDFVFKCFQRKSQTTFLMVSWLCIGSLWALALRPVHTDCGNGNGNWNIFYVKNGLHWTLWKCSHGELQQWHRQPIGSNTIHSFHCRNRGQCQRAPRIISALWISIVLPSGINAQILYISWCTVFFPKQREEEEKKTSSRSNRWKSYWLRLFITTLFIPVYAVSAVGMLLFWCICKKVSFGLLNKGWRILEIRALFHNDMLMLYFL